MPSNRRHDEETDAGGATDGSTGTGSTGGDIVVPPAQVIDYSILGNRKCMHEVVLQSSNWDQPQLDAVYATAASLGVSVVRFGFEMSLILPDSSNSVADHTHYNWGATGGGDAGYDALMRTAHDNGVYIVAVVPELTPRWANGGDTVVNGPPQDMAVMTEFVSAIVNRYKPGGTFALSEGWTDGYGLLAIEIANEPNLGIFWRYWDPNKLGPGLGGYWQSPQAERYLDMLQRSFVAAKAADPNIIVVGFNISLDGANPDNHSGKNNTPSGFIAQMVAAGQVVGYYDVACIHPMYSTHGQSTSAMIDQAASRLSQFTGLLSSQLGDTTSRIWCTEFNCGKVPSESTAAQQANKILATYTTGFESWRTLYRVDRIFHSYLHDTNSDDSGIVEFPATFPGPTLKTAATTLRDSVPNTL